ncbi:MAG: GNAT family N-acetyltransferase [Bdellovibrionota bacterium]
MKIQKATSEDFEKIVPLFDLYRQFYKHPPDQEAARCFLQERLVKNESVIFYAQDPSQATVGFIQLYPSFSSMAMKRLWILNDLFVAPSARRMNIGRSLLLKAIDYAKETNARGLTLKTAKDNLPAQRLYESLDWKQDQRFYSYDIAVSAI